MLKDKLIKSSQSSKIMVSVSIVGIVALAAYNWTVSPLTTYLHAAELYESVMSNAQKKAAMIETQIHEKQSEFEKMQKEISDIENGFFTTVRAVEFFHDLEPISLQTNCNIESFEFVSDAGNSRENDYGVVSKSAEISFTGYYDDIIKFLQKLSHCSEHISINKVFIESIQPKDKKLTCEITVTIYIVQNKEMITDE